MGKIAFVFPGQGAQSVGMGKDVYEAAAESRRIFDAADEALGYSLSRIAFEGPEEELKITYHTQPALLTTSIAYLEAFRARHDVRPDFAAGHSLGEYSALVAAGAIGFEDAVRTVRARGEFMEQAVPGGIGAMAAVLGAERDALQRLCSEISSGGAVVELANLNCPGQIVVSGSKEGVAAVIERGKEIGAKRVLQLEVSGPFHSSLMKPASERLAGVLAELPMKSAAVPVVANVTAKAVQEPGEIRELLVEQVHSSVLWEDSVSWLIAQGVDTFVEFGSGTVLAGLIKKIDRTVKTYSINSLEAINKFQLETAASSD
ncbi:ACP S-malonyltransferase [Paenibacillus filicis]|uniref:Malonyl CoA-acyl carrier protein transacylase n=1 Tax=Paenibacillus gyeongsangnamensis TaxID=3388067 RepID=A0ABT4Q6K6_9BACL|nr:ACP S-malonyltransferase [Paenibacillus filicis]MCZ8512461.1 ACP S-malonyltransferase [Paenibacillus filicis]